MSAPQPGFGLYVHWPFCRKKCPYCDFNSHVRPEVDQARWRAGLLRELTHYADELAAAGRPLRLTSIFFGGGTPSLMPPETVAAVIAEARRRFAVAEDLEITLEANPTSSEAAAFQGFAEAGVNRLSLGVQALSEAALAFLGREHSAAEALEAVALARRYVPRVSFDMIYARPGQSPAEWQAELRQALAQGPEHISLYQLTIEEGTAFHAAWRRGELIMPGEGPMEALYDATQEALEGEGLVAYEVSNHARPGAECRHNLTYWRYGDYIGVGPGAHGRLTLVEGKVATRQHRAPEAWLETVERQGHATRAHDLLSAEERLVEMVMMGLRLEEGIARAAFRRELGREPEDLLAGPRLQALIANGDLRLDNEKLQATRQGRLRLNAVTGYLLG